MTKLFFDTEFVSFYKNASLVSIGIVSDCGKTFYSEFTDYDASLIAPLPINMFCNLILSKQDNVADLNQWKLLGETESIKQALGCWLKQFVKVEMWSDGISYNWILFDQLLGSCFGIPKNIYHIPFDINTLFKAKGVNPDVNREDFAGDEHLKLMSPMHEGLQHCALWGAYVTRACYNKLEKL